MTDRPSTGGSGSMKGLPSKGGLRFLWNRMLSPIFFSKIPFAFTSSTRVLAGSVRGIRRQPPRPFGLPACRQGPEATGVGRRDSEGGIRRGGETCGVGVAAENAVGC